MYMQKKHLDVIYTTNYNERRKAKARLSNFSKQEALNTIRKNFMQAPKY